MSVFMVVIVKQKEIQQACVVSNDHFLIL